MVFGLFASVATDLMFLSVQVQYLLRSTYLSWPVSCAYSVYFNGFAAAVSAAWGTVANTRFLACSVYTLCMYFNGFEAAVSAAWGTVANTRFFGSDLDGVRPFRIRRRRPHVFVCAGSVIATVHLSVLTCVVCSVYSVYFNGFEAAVSAAWGTVANSRFLALFGLFASVATDLMFLSVQVRYLLRSTYLSWPV